MIAVPRRQRVGSRHEDYRTPDEREAALTEALYGMAGRFTATELARVAGNSDWRRLAASLLRRKFEQGVVEWVSVNPNVWEVIPDD